MENGKMENAIKKKEVMGKLKKIALQGKKNNHGKVDWR